MFVPERLDEYRSFQLLCRGPGMVPPLLFYFRDILAELDHGPIWMADLGWSLSRRRLELALERLDQLRNPPVGGFEPGQALRVSQSRRDISAVTIERDKGQQ